MKLANKNYYLDADGKVTTDQEKAATHLINEGQEITPEISSKYADVKSTDSDSAPGHLGETEEARKASETAQADVAARRTDEAKAVEAQAKNAASRTKLGTGPTANK